MIDFQFVEGLFLHSVDIDWKGVRAEFGRAGRSQAQLVRGKLTCTPSGVMLSEVGEMLWIGDTNFKLEETGFLMD